ncbi:hypothetical protein [Brevibacillus fulvus]|uniref:Uncharacterized protein n=1 Tax=Brevibacillus fulvus TaxID=1125967 RepID=A0A938Y5I1_9BACL|nr:hypothetical protein [Brevibacillus fulvus]MBM7592311.1 hypothetical protein [Brevibacillus fulvus]
MTNVLVLLILLVMVGTLSVFIWNSYPLESWTSSQDLRIKKVAYLSFH